MNPQSPDIKPGEHLFAPFVRTLGKGKKGSRSLSKAEAYTAMSMILDGQVEDVQLGAFLMLLRVKEESAEEIAGFVEAVRDTLNVPAESVPVDLDWSSYAGKKRQQPWFVLSALLLASHGYRVFMHGSSGHTAGRLYTEQVLSELGIAVSQSWDDVAQQLENTNFSFMPLQHLCSPLQRIIELRPILGLRSPVHTLVRLLNPLKSPHSIQSIFHPAYSGIQQQAAAILGENRTAVFKGDSGEVERKPEANCLVKSTDSGDLSEETWPRLIEGRQENEQLMDANTLRSVWRNEQEHDYGRLAVIGTTAVALKLMAKAESQQEALTLAETLWKTRDKNLL